jgi:hypothetical protein
MPIVLPCPHCSHPLSVPEELGGREFPCPLCNKPLTVAAVVPSVVPSAAPQFDFSEVQEEPLSESPPKKYGTPVSSERISELLPEWKRAWRGLNSTCFAVKLVIPVFFLRILLMSVLLLRIAEDYAFALVIVVSFLYVMQLVAICAHLRGQWMCSTLPEKYGTWAARTSCYIALTVILVYLSLIVTLITSIIVPGTFPIILATLVILPLFAFPFLLVYSCWYWVSFLRKLGAGFGRYELVGVSRSFMMWLWIVFGVQMLLLFIENASNLSLRGIELCFGTPVGILTICALFSYNRLVRTARDTIARHGPVQPLDAYWDEEETESPES